MPKMKIIRSWSHFPKADCPNGTAVLIGSFDGLHLGHQALIQMAQSEAKMLGLPVVLVTFEPSPKNYFSQLNQGQPTRLFNFYDKCLLLQKMGVDFLLVLKFNQALMQITPEAFLDKLRENIQPKLYCLGQDFKFGQYRAGNIETIEQYALKHNQAVKVLQTIEDKIGTQDLIRISTTLLKKSLLDGDLVTSRRLLNRPYRLSGKVRPGKKLGQTIGVRTANIYLNRCAIPLRGVYAVRISKIETETVNYQGVANIGVRPTVHQDNQLVLEVHIFEKFIDLYGKRIEIEFIEKIREERKFPDLEALKKQIKEDSEQAKLILSNTE